MILGIDLGGYHCGWAVLDAKGKRTVLVETGLVEPKEAWDFWSRCDYVVANLESVIAKYRVTKMVMEKLRLFHQSRISFPALQDLGRLSGAVGLMSFRRSLEIVEVHTSHWRKSVIGDGRAKKEDAVKLVKTRHGVDLETDVAEAVCLAEYGYLVGLPARGKPKNGKRQKRKTRKETPWS